MHKNIPLIRLYNFLSEFRFYMPFMVVYFAEISGSYSLAMFCFGISSISSAVFEIPTGIFSDRIGRKKTLLLGAFFAIFSLLAYSFATSFAYLVIGAIINALSWAFLSGNNDALIYDSLKESGREKEFHEVIGKTSSLFELSLAIASVLGAIIVIYFPFQILFILSLLPITAAFIVGFFIQDTKKHDIGDHSHWMHLKTSVQSDLEEQFFAFTYSGFECELCD